MPGLLPSAHRGGTSARAAVSLSRAPLCALLVEKIDQDVALHLAEVKAYHSGTVALRYEVQKKHGGLQNVA